MIKLIVEDYCHDCPDFEAEVRKGAKASTIDGHVARCTNIFCVHRLKCDHIARYLAKRMEEKKDDDFPKLIKERAHPEDGCGLDCVYVHEIDEIMKELTEEANESVL